MLKDNENMPFPDAGPAVRSDTQGFAADEMVRCEKCLRSNPPTRSNCLYCAAALLSGKRVDTRKPTLKPLEDSVLGFNCILLPRAQNASGAVNLEAVAQFLKLELADLQRIIDFQVPLPLARTETRGEGELVKNKLDSFGLTGVIVSDRDLGLPDAAIVQIRAAELGAEEINLRQFGGGEGTTVHWEQIILIVSGRLITKRVESAEQKGRRGEKEIIEAREFFADQPVIDIYLDKRKETFRIAANNFDYSSLPGRGLLVSDNFASLLRLIQARAPEAKHDDLYLSLRQTLNLVWPCGQRTSSAGLRRDRPGKYSVEAVTESSNVNQFTRYSRLRSFLFNPTTRSNQN